MTIIKEALFEPQRTEEERALDKSTVFPVRLNLEEQAELKACMPLIQQVKDSTALKQLAKIGASVVLHDQKTRMILGIILENERRNARTGVPVEPASFKQN